MSKIKFSINCPTCRQRLIENEGYFDNKNYVDLHFLTILDFYCECCDTTWCVNEVEVKNLKDV